MSRELRSVARLSLFAFEFGWQRVSILLMIPTVALTLRASPLEFQVGDGFRRAKLPVLQSGKTGFEKLDNESSGISFTNRLAENRSILNRNLLNGSGVAIGDVD